ncbi:hypothetical protein ID853_17540 [Xenorhabdus sp. Vera]|uniref:hypothetical protein n=1 Tax=Xenorhabdus TaxID=626 RepID=UPI0019BA5FF9|nr:MULTISPECIES: hypothetical protein [unclassified Xenorhabdus]MBD2812627.1 hypothetical protein [Xenorhabdus sp. Vera]
MLVYHPCIGRLLGSIGMNWQEHVSNFNRLRAENGISIREYAEHYNLNPNTAPVDDQTHDHTAIHDHRFTPQKTNREKGKSAKTRAPPDAMPEKSGEQTLANDLCRSKAQKAGTRK